MIYVVAELEEAQRVGAVRVDELLDPVARMLPKWIRRGRDDPSCHRL
jgi:hypothetical protein